MSISAPDGPRRKQQPTRVSARREPGMSPVAMSSAAMSSAVQRHVLAIFCILFFAAGILAPWIPYLNDGGSDFASGSLLKLGIVLFVAWLAAPQLERLGWQRLRGSALLGLLFVAGAFAIRPRLGAIAAVVFVAGAVFFGLLGWIRTLGGSKKA